jgi:hypothetical protein
LSDNAGDCNWFGVVVFRPERMVRQCGNSAKQASDGQGD